MLIATKRQHALNFVGCAFLLLISWRTASADPKLPDLFAWDSVDESYMYGGVLDRDSSAGRVLYRFNLPIANIGTGPLELRELTHADASQDVYQRVYNTDNSITETLIGTFPDANPPYGHLWFKGIATYNLREVTSGGGVGPIVSTHEKISYALLDGPKYNTSLPGAPQSKVYSGSQSALLGISVGWADIYTLSLSGQYVEATGLTNGTYWLEVIIDPYGRIQESTKSNNTTRVLVDLMVLPGDYNHDRRVDAGDYVIWRDMRNQNVPVNSSADGTGNGFVDAADYQVWKTHFGEAQSGSGSSAPAAPEPTAIALVLMATAAVGWAHRGCRHADCRCN